MRKILLTVLFLFFVLIIYSQNTEYKYFTFKYKSTKEKRAKIIRKIEKINDTLYHVTDYDNQENLLMKGEYSSIRPMVENGYFEFYDFFNYAKVATGNYSDGLMVGKWKYDNYNSRTTKTVNYNIVLVETEKDRKSDSEKGKTSDSEEEFIVVDVMPKFRNGNTQSFASYIGRNLIYPPMAQKYSIEETVYLQFDINTNGQVCNIEVLRKVNKDLEREAIRVVAQSEKWSPGSQKGKAITVRFTFPINFDLK